MSDRIIQAYYGEYPRINKRTPVDITSRVESDHFASLFEAIEDDCNLEPYGYKIGDYFESHNAHTVTYDNNSSGGSTQTVKFRYWLADPDTYYGGYSNNCVVDKHHLAIIVDTKTNKRFNDGTFTGYENSRLQTWLKSSECLDNIKKDLGYILTGNANNDGTEGNKHLLSHKKLFAKYASSAYNWSFSVNPEKISALTEIDIYGCIVWSGADTVADRCHTGESVKQLDLFNKFRFYRLMGNNFIWLRSCMNASDACLADKGGFSGHAAFSSALDAVGIILLSAEEAS